MGSDRTRLSLLRCIRRPLQETYWRLFQRRFYASWREQRRVRALPLPEIRQIQWRRLKKLLQYAYENTDFYQQYFASASLTPADIRRPEDLLRLPVTDKQTYRTYFPQILARHIREADLVPSYTSGSSGEPFRFYLDPVTEAAHTAAAYALNREAMGIAPWDRINELVLKVKPKNPVDLTRGAPRGRILSLKGLLTSEHVGISTNDIAPANIETIAQIIQRRNLRAVYGYSSSVFSLARYLSARPDVPKMRYAITIAEGLLRQQRDYISEVFECPVYQDYSASECMRMGFECTCRNGYHMDLYNYYFEYLGESGYAKEDGTGEIIVTNLNNYVFPFIRYQVGDRGEPCRGVCRCGVPLPMMRTLSGRSSDLITTPTGKDITPESFTVFFEYLDRYVRQFQVVQSARDALIIRIVPAEPLRDDIRGQIEEKIRGLVEASMTIQVMCVSEIALEATGKRRFVVPLPRTDFSESV
jgi:phenylacetate-CoA ligase